jgi:hypothetical protein
MTVSGVEPLNLDCYDYLSLKHSLKKGERSTVRLTPISGDNAFSFNSNRVIMFDIPYIKGAFWDLKNTSLQFTGAATGTGTQAFNNFIESVINRWQLFLADGTSEVETINYYNLKANALLKYEISEDYKNTIAFEQWGVADQGTRLKWASGRDYAVNLIGSGFMSSPMKYIPLNILAKNNYSRSLHIEITLEDPNICMFGNVGSTLNYALSGVFLQMDLIMMQEYNMELEMKINNGSMKMAIPFCTSHTWQNQILNGVSGRQNFSLQEYKQYMTGIMTLFTGATNITQEYTNNFVNPNLVNYQWLLSNKYYPTKEIVLHTNNGVTPSFNELMKYFNKMKMYSQSTTGGIISNPNEFLIYNENVGVAQTEIISADVILSPQNLFLTIIGTTTNQKITTPSSLWSINQSLIGNPNITLPSGSNGVFSVLVSGFYDLSLTVQGKLSNTAGAANALSWGVQLYTLSGSTYVPYAPVTTNYSSFRANNTTDVSLVQGPTSPVVTLSVNQVVYLSSGVNYVFGGYQDQTVIATNLVAVVNSTLSAKYVSGATVADSKDFVIGQTLRTFYDMDDHMDNMSEYLLDGINVSTPSTFNINIASPLGSAVQMYHFVDYTTAIVIDNEKVLVIN